MSCPFCEIMANRSEYIAIIEPLNPVVPGHRIAIPRDHVEHAGERPWITAHVMRRAVVYAETLGCDYNVITSRGKDATQSVYHLHVHIVPRHEGDGLTLPWTGQQRRTGDDIKARAAAARAAAANGPSPQQVMDEFLGTGDERARIVQALIDEGILDGDAA